MIIAYKAGGNWKDENGNTYDAKPVNKLSDAGEGYFATLEEALKVKSKPAKQQKAKAEKPTG